MILLSILLLTALLLTVLTIVAVSAIGAGAIVLFGDVIVCVVFIVLLIKFVIKRKRK